MSAKGRRLGLLVLLGCAASGGLLSGCGIGIAGLFLALSEEGDDGSDLDAPATVTFEGTPRALGSPDQVEIRYKVRNDDAGSLSARIAVLRVQVDDGFQVVRDPRGEPIPLGDPVQALPVPGSTPAEALPNDVFVSFVWDVKQTLGEDSAMVEVLVTPVEDGKEGRPERSAPFRAGNEPVRLENLSLFSSKNILAVTFDLADRESDRVKREDGLMKVELSIDGGDFAAVPLDMIQRQDFVSAPGSGAQGTFNLDLERLGKRPDVAAGLSALAASGFVAVLGVRLSMRDFSEEPPSAAEATLRYDNNDAPRVDVVPLPPQALTQTIIPLRYRIFDTEMNPADVSVEVDLGGGFRRALEFPRSPSEGTLGRCTLSPLADPFASPCRESGQTHVHTFLWDALAELAEPQTVAIRIKAADREEGEPGAQTVTVQGPAACGLEWGAQIGTGTGPGPAVKGDFDGDGRLDVIVLNSTSSDVTFLRGTSDGPQRVRNIPMTQAPPVDVAAGDFNGDGFEDAVVGDADGLLTLLPGGKDGPASCSAVECGKAGGRPQEFLGADFNGDRIRDFLVRTLQGVTFASGGKGGMAPVPLALDAGGKPRSLVPGDFDGDATMDVVIIRVPTGADRDAVRFLHRGLLQASDVQVGRDPRRAASGDFDGDGRLDLAVANYDSDDISFLRGTPDALAWVRDVGSSPRPKDMVSGDFNGDSFLDVAVTYVSSKELTFLRGGPDGLQETEEIQMPSVVGVLFPVDFDGDGFLDLWAGQPPLGCILLRGGTSGLGPAEPTGLPATASRVLSGDFDRDGRTDLVVMETNGDRDADRLMFLRWASQGMAIAGVLPLGQQTRSALTGDFDGDGFPDVVVTNMQSNDVTFVRGTSTHLVRAAEIGVGDLGEGLWPRDMANVASGDFDGDGLLDLAVLNFHEDSITYLQGSVTGPLWVREIEVGAKPRDIASGDFDADGFLDVLVTSVGTNQVAFLRGTGEGLKPGGILPVGAGPTHVETGDFSGDGVEDAAVLNSDGDSLTYVEGRKSTGPMAPRTIPVAQLARSVEWRSEKRTIASGDFDGDGVTDLVVLSVPGNALTYMRGIRLEGLASPNLVISTLGSLSERLTVGDFNGDGRTDVVLESDGTSSVIYLPGTDAGPARSRSIGVGADTADFATGDFNGDGFLDLAVTSFENALVTYIPGSADGLAPSGVRLPAGANPRRMATGDFDGDGFLDLVAGNSGGSSSLATPPSTVTYLRGTPKGLARVGDLLAGVQPERLATGDFDGDGLTDVVVTNYGARSITYLRGSLNGLERVGEIAAGLSTFDTKVGDFDGDGHTDIVVLNEASNTLTYLRQRYLTPHVNLRIDPSGTGVPLGPIVDPRYPPRFRLELPAGAFDRPSEVCIVPGTHFDIPQAEAAARGRYLTIVADPTSILREATRILTPATLTLRLRDRVPEALEDIAPEQWTLRVFRQSLETGKPEEIASGAGKIAIVDFEGAKGVAFPIERFGTYLVAVELDR